MELTDNQPNREHPIERRGRENDDAGAVWQGMLGATISNMVVKEHSHGKKWYLGRDLKEAREGGNPVDIWEEDILGRGNHRTKALRQETARQCPGTVMLKKQ